MPETRVSSIKPPICLMKFSDQPVGRPRDQCKFTQKIVSLIKKAELSSRTLNSRVKEIGFFNDP